VGYQNVLLRIIFQKSIRLGPDSCINKVRLWWIARLPRDLRSKKDPTEAGTPALSGICFCGRETLNYLR